MVLLRALAGVSSVAIGEDVMSRATPCSSPMLTDIADRSSLIRRSALPAWFAIGQNTIEGVVANRRHSRAVASADGDAQPGVEAGLVDLTGVRALRQPDGAGSVALAPGNAPRSQWSQMPTERRTQCPAPYPHLPSSSTKA